MFSEGERCFALWTTETKGHEVRSQWSMELIWMWAWRSFVKLRFLAFAGGRGWTRSMHRLFARELEGLYH